MRAVLYEHFREPPRVHNVANPTPTAQGVVIKVEASGLCRSDWHGWMGHDPDISCRMCLAMNSPERSRRSGSQVYAMAAPAIGSRCRSQ